MKILIRGTNWIGDAIMSIPAMREIRRIFPDSHITLHTRSLCEGLFRNASFLDDIISFERNRWPITDVYDNAGFLKESNFDVAILFPNSFESALVPFLARIPKRIGYNKDARGLLLTHPIAVPEWKNRRHEVFYYLNLVGELESRILGRQTVAAGVPDMTLEITEERRSEARRKLSSGTSAGQKIVLLGIGSTNSNAKRWPAERFAMLSDKILSELGAKVVLVGSKGDLPAAEAVMSSVQVPPLNFVGETSVAEAAALISISDLLISNDMGLAHIAPAVGTRSIAILGPTNPLTTRPYSPLAKVLRNDVPCSPCMLRECPIDHRCMTGISPETVFLSAVESLAEIEEVSYETTGGIS